MSSFKLAMAQPWGRLSPSAATARPSLARAVQARRATHAQALFSARRGAEDSRPASSSSHRRQQNQPLSRPQWSKQGAFDVQQAPLGLFPRRHIGPDESDVQEMLRALDPPAASVDEFVSQVVPADILTETALFTSKDGPGHDKPVPEDQLPNMMPKSISFVPYSAIGGGYYETIVPPVIQRNVFENPAWYTSYTPYQPEISQGRLESLLNFQTMVCDLTGLPIANASLLDEGTAAAEAMTMSLSALSSSRQKAVDKVYVVSDMVHPQTLSVLRSRAEGFGVKVQSMDLAGSDTAEKIKALGTSLVGVLVQYPDTNGGVEDFRALADVVHSQGALLAAATDLMALTVLTPPGEWGADIALGSSQRFGVPMGMGGPHAAFFAVKEAHKRRMPGRLIGVSKDRLGGRALRLSLQTREQHIRREKATSNVCTAQALLANMSAFYAIYHGPQGLKDIAVGLIRAARVVQNLAQHYGFTTYRQRLDSEGKVLFDTVIITTENKADANLLVSAARENGVFVRQLSPFKVGISVGETMASLGNKNLRAIATAFQQASPEATARDINPKTLVASLVGRALKEDILASIPEPVRRKSDFLQHPVFNSHHSETELLRYIHHLQSKDLSLVHSMIPLGSCTMKLNGTTEMMTVNNSFSSMHPYTPLEDRRGADIITDQLDKQLASITGMDAVSLQPNSGAQGEFAGLRVIRKYHEQQPGAKRDICLIPVSAHGTNPASAAMAGMRVVPIKCDTKTGNLDIEDLEAKCKQYADELGAIMITYPSTFGIFEPAVKKACEIVHQYGGLVYMDGANMTAQIGLCSPGEIGADVCHLNLHKTFCIPHGGGGPGVGPICVKGFLEPYLPGKDWDPKIQPMVASAPYGSWSILSISWAYIKLMGASGLKQATQIGLLNANYLLSRLAPHYKILYTNEHGRCAHEFIIDARPFKESAGIEAIDIAKRLQDYGFHAPTMSWPVPGTLMIEPTESESKEELDRFAEALISIREEIREIEEGKQPKEGNVLRMAPHPQGDLILGDDGEGSWGRPYSRVVAAYPLPWLKEKKFWPTVARVDDTYGDMNLFCTCPPVEDTTQAV